MTKRKRETADEESIHREQSKKAKKQKTNTNITPQVKSSSNTPLKHTQTAKSVQALHDEGSKKLARKIAKREKRALAKAQRDESAFKDGSKTGDADGNNGLAEYQDRKSVGKGEAANRHESQEREEEGGQNLTNKHRSKKEKRKERGVRSSGKKSGKKSRRKDVERATWTVSDPSGGQMLDVDPIFSPDEK